MWGSGRPRSRPMLKSEEGAFFITQRGDHRVHRNGRDGFDCGDVDHSDV